MILAPHVISGITELGEEEIDCLKHKLSGLISIYNDTYAVKIVVSDLYFSCYYESAVANFMGSIDEIIDKIKEIYSELDFEPFIIGFDFIGEGSSERSSIN